MRLEEIQHLNEQCAGLEPAEIIRLAFRKFQDGLTFASSLGEEDQIILDIISKTHPDIDAFTLDTGRLFKETYDLIARNKTRYAVSFHVYYPDSQAIEDMVAAHGINLFYESLSNRKLCCRVRKLEPLRRALKDKSAWITGLRRSQSLTRHQVEFFEWDQENEKVKINPLLMWSREQVQRYIEEFKIDINPLHQEGFVSIGCACCTRAINDGEDIRAGRWWWEEPEHRECGLHNHLKIISNQENRESTHE